MLGHLKSALLLGFIILIYSKLGVPNILII